MLGGCILTAESHELRCQDIWNNSTGCTSNLERTGTPCSV